MKGKNVVQMWLSFYRIELNRWYFLNVITEWILAWYQLATGEKGSAGGEKEVVQLLHDTSADSFWSS